MKLALVHHAGLVCKWGNVAFGSAEFKLIWDNTALRQAVIEEMETQERAKKADLGDFYTLLDTYFTYQLARQPNSHFPSMEKTSLSRSIQQSIEKAKITPEMRLAEDRAQADYHAQMAAERRASRQNMAG